MANACPGRHSGAASQSRCFGKQPSIQFQAPTAPSRTAIWKAIACQVAAHTDRGHLHRVATAGKSLHRVALRMVWGTFTRHSNSISSNIRCRLCREKKQKKGCFGKSRGPSTGLRPEPIGEFPGPPRTPPRSHLEPIGKSVGSAAVVDPERSRASWANSSLCELVGTEPETEQIGK